MIAYKSNHDARTINREPRNTMHLPTPSPVHAKSSLPTLLLITVTMMFSTACSVFGIQSVEEAPYQLVRQEKQFEIRDYEPAVVAETRVNASFKKAGNQAFRRLFAYITGDNEAQEKIAMTAPVIAESNDGKSGEKIAMTAPVIAEQEGEAWRYRFVLPRTYTIDTAPRPLNPEVTLVETQTRRVATIRFSGRSSLKSREKNTEVLTQWIQSQGLTAQSEPRWAGYNGPLTLPPFRRNEVLIDIAN